MSSPSDDNTVKPSNFLRHIIEGDIAAGTYTGVVTYTLSTP